MSSKEAAKKTMAVDYSLGAIKSIERKECGGGGQWKHIISPLPIPEKLSQRYHLYSIVLVCGRWKTGLRLQEGRFYFKVRPFLAVEPVREGGMIFIACDQARLGM